MSAPLLEVRDLRVGTAHSTSPLTLVDGVDLALEAGRTLAVVGESGCGKSLLVRAIPGLLPPGVHLKGGSVRLRGEELTALSADALQRVRGRGVATVFQDPGARLDPLMRCGDALAEVLRLHSGFAGPAARAEAVEALRRVGIADPERRAREYPHQLSGGMRQRVALALALACRPALLIADEPTTALDVTLQAQVLALLREAQHATGMGLLLVTHDLGVVAECADEVLVLYAGQVVERAPVTELFTAPRHPYTAALLASRPGGPGAGIPGLVPDPAAMPNACRFHPRCPFVLDRCRLDMPALVSPANGREVRCHRHAEGLVWPSAAPEPA